VTKRLPPWLDAGGDILCPKNTTCHIEGGSFRPLAGSRYPNLHALGTCSQCNQVALGPPNPPLSRISDWTLNCSDLLYGVKEWF